MHLVGDVTHSVLVAEALLGGAVNDDGRPEALGPNKGLLDRVPVVPVDRADVLQPEVLEQSLRGQHVFEALLDPVQRVEQRLTDERCVRATS